MSERPAILYAFLYGDSFQGNRSDPLLLAHPSTEQSLATIFQFSQESIPNF